MAGSRNETSNDHAWPDWLQVVKLLPQNGYWLACLAKQITDQTYLDFAPAKQRLTDDERRSFNVKAIELANKVRISTVLTCRGPTL